MDYKQSLNLPQTAFPMRAGLAEKEPRMLAAWAADGLFEKIRAARAGGPSFILHDGPPYANGKLHHGHILNKCLKDMVLKDRAMAGFAVSYVPGWDCHGLPIEVQVDKQLGRRKQSMSAAEFRAACRAYAQEQVAQQRQSFLRLGVGGQWDSPYLTMDYGYEAAIIRQFGQLVARGLLYKGLRPTHWCPVHRTALADAEIEYADHASPSAYVAFDVVDASLPPALRDGDAPLQLVIWTTTPWTLPANQAICVHPELDYQVVDVGGRRCLVAQALSAAFLTAIGAPANPAQGMTIAGRELAQLRYRHPFLPRASPVLLATHVTADVGTGCVHTAPAHGADDFAVGVAHGLELSCPVDAAGVLMAPAGPFAGQALQSASAAILAHLEASGHLLSSRTATLTHRYPHCWRCHKPILVRATEQWFVAMDRPLDGKEGPSLRQRALESLTEVRWLPSWGKQRMAGMLSKRPDWCLSRQRLWGVPVVMAYCSSCQTPLAAPELFERVATRVEKEGSEAWFAEPLEAFVEAPRCVACGHDTFVKESDILDVWFDSGASFAAVLEGPGAPATGPLCDLVLEGSDQHRGWFHAALLLALCNRGAPPYRAVLTHGFVVDGQGKKISKSLGNFVDPQQTIARDGAELLRLWVAQEDPREDVRLSPQILARLSESYRKVRNTLRFILGNLGDFRPAEDSVDAAALTSLDRMALARHLDCVAAVRRAYADCLFHQGVGLWVDHCTSELSAFYFDVLKDRLYASAPAAAGRRAAQTALYLIGRDLLRLLAPVLCFTAEEAWGHLPKLPGDPYSVHLCLYPPAPQTPAGDADMAPLRRAIAAQSAELGRHYAPLLALRRQVNVALEAARREKIIGASTQAAVHLRLSAAEQAAALQAFSPAEMADFFIVSSVRWVSGDAVDSQVTPIEVQITAHDGGRCARCWLWRAEVVAAQICHRCQEAMQHVA